MAKRRAMRLSLGQLQRLAAQRKADLEQRRAILEKELQSIESELEGTDSAPRAPKKGRGRATRVRRMRVGGQPPLRDVLVGVLQKSPSGMDLKTLAKAVRDAGYKTRSKNFENTVYQCVYTSAEFIRDKRSKKYRLKGRKTG
jgi:hypothetical protein